MKSLSRMARNVIAAGGGNVLDDLYSFYNDGRWVVEVVRKMSSVLSAMAGGMNAYAAHMPKLEECIGYISQSRIDGMGTASFVKEIRSNVSALKKARTAWANADDDSKADEYSAYMEIVMSARDYCVSFEKSCVNAFRNSYIGDEENVRNLLDVIHASGNYVMNSGVQQVNDTAEKNN